MDILENDSVESNNKIPPPIVRKPSIRLDNKPVKVLNQYEGKKECRKSVLTVVGNKDDVTVQINGYEIK